jgi:hypothetical protein
MRGGPVEKGGFRDMKKFMAIFVAAILLAAVSTAAYAQDLKDETDQALNHDTSWNSQGDLISSMVSKWACNDPSPVIAQKPCGGGSFSGNPLQIIASLQALANSGVNISNIVSSLTGTYGNYANMFSSNISALQSSLNSVQTFGAQATTFGNTTMTAP